MRRSGNLFLILGCLLLAAAAALLLVQQGQARRTVRENSAVVQTMQTMLADRWQGSVDPEHTGNMPALELEGTDYVALLEIPDYNLQLPVAAAWDPAQVSRYDGTAYNGTLVIGGADHPGQFGCFDKIGIGTQIILTDMTGCTFTYTVQWVDRLKNAETADLTGGDGDLTLFVRDSQLLEYIILRCAAG